MPFACIYVPNFSVAAVLRAEPELKTRAGVIHSRAVALGLEANVAIASNPDTAVLAARGLCATGSCGAGATARAAVTVIPPGKEAEQLGSLPVEVLFTDREDADGKKSAS